MPAEIPTQVRVPSSSLWRSSQARILTRFVVIAVGKKRAKKGQRKDGSSIPLGALFKKGEDITFRVFKVLNVTRALDPYLLRGGFAAVTEN